MTAFRKRPRVSAADARRVPQGRRVGRRRVGVAAVRRQVQRRRLRPVAQEGRGQEELGLRHRDGVRGETGRWTLVRGTGNTIQGRVVHLVEDNLVEIEIRVAI